MIIYGHRYEAHIPKSTAVGPLGTFTDTIVTAFPGPTAHMRCIFPRSF